MRRSRLLALLVALSVALALLAIPETAGASQVIGVDRTHWTYVSSKYKHATHWEEDRVWVGSLADPKDVNRAFFEIDLTRIAAVKRIVDVWFGVRRAHSLECDRDIEVWETGDISPRTSWKHQPRWRRMLARLAGPSCNNMVATRITDAVRAAVAAGKTHMTIGLKAINEIDSSIKLELYNNGSFTLTYNNPPLTPSGLSVSAEASPSCLGFPVRGTSVATTTPTLKATVTDPDTGYEVEQVRARFQWTAADGTPLGEAVTDLTSSGRQACVTVPAGQMTDGSAYKWRVRAENPYGRPQEIEGYDVSDWSEWRDLFIDTVPPAGLPAISSTDYPPDTPSGHPFLPGEFRFSPNGDGDVWGYAFGFDYPYSEVAAGADGSATATLTPRYGGTHCVVAQIIDRAGSRGPVGQYCFKVAELDRYPAVSSETYPEFVEGVGGVGIPGEFVFDSGDLSDVTTSFHYSFDETAAEITPGPDGTARVTLTPTQSGFNALYVDLFNASGVSIWSITYYFDVKAATGAGEP